MQTVNLDHCAILGIDVGFSARRATTGIAWVVNGEVEAVWTHSDWPRRRLELPTSGCRRGSYGVIGRARGWTAAENSLTLVTMPTARGFTAQRSRRPLT